MARPDKVQTVAEIQESFSSATATVLTEYRGLSVKDLKVLRRSLGDDATYAITKNTLTQIAAKEAGVEGLDPYLAGPTAIAFITGDIATVAKGLRDFAKDHPALVVKAGYLDGNVLDADAVKKLADLESREVLLAKLAGALKANLSKAVYLFAAPLSKAARTVAALEAAGGANPAAQAEAAPEADPAPAAPADAEPAAPAATDAADAAPPAADETATQE